MVLKPQDVLVALVFWEFRRPALDAQRGKTLDKKLFGNLSFVVHRIPLLSFDQIAGLAPAFMLVANDPDCLICLVYPRLP